MAADWNLMKMTQIVMMMTVTLILMKLADLYARFHLASYQIQMAMQF